MHRELGLITPLQPYPTTIIPINHKSTRVSLTSQFSIAEFIWMDLIVGLKLHFRVKPYTASINVKGKSKAQAISNSLRGNAFFTT